LKGRGFSRAVKLVIPSSEATRNLLSACTTPPPARSTNAMGRQSHRRPAVQNRTYTIANFTGTLSPLSPLPGLAMQPPPNPSGLCGLKRMYIHFDHHRCAQIKTKTGTYCAYVPTGTLSTNVPAGTHLKRCQGLPCESSVPSVLKVFSGRSKGKRITSRMVCESVSSMHSRSTPTPTPPAGGIPYDSARI
jgi:hypothetical protein